MYACVNRLAGGRRCLLTISTVRNLIHISIITSLLHFTYYIQCHVHVVLLVAKNTREAIKYGSLLDGGRMPRGSKFNDHVRLKCDVIKRSTAFIIPKVSQCMTTDHEWVQNHRIRQPKAH